MKKRLISLILVLVMVIGLMPTVAFAANTTEFAGGSGTENDPYLIETKYHLDNVRNYLDAHFKMIADIEFINEGWAPIGTDLASAFTGTFDGDGFTIKNLYINISSDSIVYAGLFGYNKGVIKNLGVVDRTVSVTSTSSSYSYVYAGAITGYNSGTISNCYYTGSVSVYSYSYVYAGGIAGYNNKGTITNCYNTDKVSATFLSSSSSYSRSAYAGGIVGINEDGTITNCYNTGKVLASSPSTSSSTSPFYNTHAGGIVGCSSGTISNCYNTGSVSATSSSADSHVYAGGIVGCNDNGMITNCHNTGNVSASASLRVSSAYAGGISGYNSGTISNCYNTGTVSASAPLDYASGIVGYSSGTISNCYYLISNGVGSGTDTSTECTTDELKNQSTFFGFDFENVWTFLEGNAYQYPTLKNNEHFLIDDTLEFNSGNGIEESPYCIASKKQLNNVRNYLDAHFKLVKDIEFTDTDFAEGGDFYNNGQGFEPIGSSSSSAFTGVFDGNGFAVKKIYINISVSSSTVYSGLFGYSNGTIKNLGIVDGSISALSSLDSFVCTGGIVGCNIGTISNCYNTGEIISSENAGGIVGDNSFGIISNCYNTGKITSSEKAGGIAGINRVYSTINNCYNTGDVSAVTTSLSSNAYAGGIAGDSFNQGTINNCYNTGDVFATASFKDSYARAGGIVGNRSTTINNCYNTGDVSVVSASSSSYVYVGGIAGTNTDTISNCYNTGNISIISSSSLYTYAGGISGNNSATLSNCYNTGNVSIISSSSFHTCVGGIVGNSDYGTISNCYNVASVSAESQEYTYAGGIAGKNYSTITNCYFIDNISSGVCKNSSNETTVKCIDVQLKEKSTFIGFDFEEIWTMRGSECYAYPELQHVNFTTDHIFENVCDTICNCGYTREAFGHEYKLIYDSENHYDKCTAHDNIVNVKPHEFENTCDTTCDCGYERTITHNYEIKYNNENHFEKCSICDDIVNNTSHTFENECDTKCDCGFTRTVPHNHQPTFDDTNHFDKCTICDDKININKHSYDNECDAFCDCGYERSINYNEKFTTDETITIQFSDKKEFEFVISDETIVKITELKTNKVQFGSYIEMSATAKLKPLKPGYVLVTAVDTTGKVLAKSILYIVEGEHQLVLSTVTKEASCTEEGEELYACKFCEYQEKKPIPVLEHTYENACDTTCDCGYVRTITHNHQPTYDAQNHFDKCTVCGDVINSKAHEFKNACDTDCDCGYEREITHDYKDTYNAAGHFEECTVCGSIGDGEPHKFDNACDRDCDCGYTRITSHKYDNACDKSCNVCGATRTVPDHVYDNAFDAKCNICGAERTAPNTPTKTFADVKSNAWYKQFVDYSVAYGIFSGTSNTTFSPQTNITRAQFVQVLANLEGIDTSKSNVSSGFSDVPSGKWFTAAIRWASDNKIVSGVGDGKFAPHANVTREQMCVMLVNYAKYKGITLKKVEAKENFADDNKISKWAKDAVYACQMADIVNGKGAGKFDPSGTGTRAEACVIFTKFHKSYMK